MVIEPHAFSCSTNGGTWQNESVVPNQSVHKGYNTYAERSYTNAELKQNDRIKITWNSNAQCSGQNTSYTNNISVIGVADGKNIQIGNSTSGRTFGSTALVYKLPANTTKVTIKLHFGAGQTHPWDPNDNWLSNSISGAINVTNVEIYNQGEQNNNPDAPKLIFNTEEIKNDYNIIFNGTSLSSVYYNQILIWERKVPLVTTLSANVYNYYEYKRPAGALSSASWNLVGYDTLTLDWSIYTTMSWPNGNGVGSISRAYLHLTDGKNIFLGEKRGTLYAGGSAYSAGGKKTIDLTQYTEQQLSKVQAYCWLGDMSAGSPTPNADRHNLTVTLKNAILS